MPLPAVRQTLEQGRALTSPGTFHRFGGRFIHGKHIIAVDRFSRDAVCQGTVGEPMFLGHPRESG